MTGWLAAANEYAQIATEPGLNHGDREWGERSPSNISLNQQSSTHPVVANQTDLQVGLESVLSLIQQPPEDHPAAPQPKGQG